MVGACGSWQKLGTDGSRLERAEAGWGMQLEDGRLAARIVNTTAGGLGTGAEALACVCTMGRIGKDVLTFLLQGATCSVYRHLQLNYKMTCLTVCVEEQGVLFLVLSARMPRAPAGVVCACFCRVREEREGHVHTHKNTREYTNTQLA